MDEHIRIGDVAPRVQYVADGAQSAFTYPFPIFAPADIAVWIDAVRQVAGFAVAGAGASEGGVVTFEAPPRAGSRITLRRALVVARTSDFQENGVLRARTLNDELDYQVAALQEVKEDLAGTLRLDPSDGGTLRPLPQREGRANRILGFDPVGDVAVFDRDEATMTLDFPGAIPRTVEDKLAERLSARDFGAVGDGVVDDGPALQAAMNAATATGRVLEIGEGSFRTAMPLRLGGGAAGLAMRGTIVYAGADGQAALTIGDATVRSQARHYQGLKVLRATQSGWLDERDIGLRLLNFDACRVEILLVQGFHIGVRTEGSGIQASPAGFEDSDIHLGRLVNNRIGLDIWCSTPGPWAWNNSVRYYGGHFANSGSTHPGIARYGVRLARAPGAYALHNAHVFHGPAFELQNGYQAGGVGAVDAIPFLNLTAGRAVVARGVRMEGCSPYVAEHRNAGLNSDVPARIDAQDCVYEVLYASNGGQPNIGGLPLGDSYLVGIKYGPGCNRAGGTVIPMAQAAAATRCTRLIAEAANLRAAAHVWEAARPLVTPNPVPLRIGVERMCVVSSNPAGAPTTLGGLAFPGLDGIAATGDGLTFPTSRGIGWVVRTDTCKEFEVAFDGNRCRPFVMMFDAAENVILPTLVNDPDGARTAATGLPPLPPGIFDPDPDPNRPDYDPDPELPPVEEIPLGEVVPDPEGPRVLFSNAGTIYNQTARWWMPGAEPSDFTVSRLQRITLPPECRIAILGIASLGTEYEDADRDGNAGETMVLRSARLYCPPEHAPSLLYGGARGWGSTVLRASHAGWVIPDLPAGASAQLSTVSADQVLVPGARLGDAVQVGYVLDGNGTQNGGVVFSGTVSNSDRVSVSVHNQSAGTIQMDGGATRSVTLTVTVTKAPL